jgi:hypothetical protein
VFFFFFIGGPLVRGKDSSTLGTERPLAGGRSQLSETSDLSSLTPRLAAVRLPPTAHRPRGDPRGDWLAGGGKEQDLSSDVVAGGRGMRPPTGRGTRDTRERVWSSWLLTFDVSHGRGGWWQMAMRSRSISESWGLMWGIVAAAAVV